MKKLIMMITLMMCFVVMSYGQENNQDDINKQDTIITTDGRVILGTQIKLNNKYIRYNTSGDKQIVYNYIDIDGNQKTILSDKIERISSIKSFVSLDTEMKLSDEKPLSDNDLNLGGRYIEKGGMTKNLALFINLAGISAVGLGVTEGSSILIKFGAALTLISIPINISGNNQISKGGRLIKNYKVK